MWILAACAFFAFIVWVGNPRDLLTAVVSLGPGLALILALHLIVTGLDAVAWRALLPAPRVRLSVWFLARSLRDAVNRLLPVAQIGGEIAGARVLSLAGATWDLAGASVILDKLAEAASQLLYTLLGLAVFVTLRGGRDHGTEAALIGAAVLLLGLLVFAAAARSSRCRLLGAVLLARLEQRFWGAFAPLRRVAATLGSLSSRDRFLRAIAWHLAAWLLAAFEVWLALFFMGHEVSLARALALESVSQALASLGFFVPAALGVQEGAYVAIGLALGVPLEVALALSLIKRLRQIALGLPALAFWHVAELRSLPSRHRTGPMAPPLLPSSHSNAYVRRLLRRLLKPLAATPLHPNHLTVLRIATGFGACAAAIGGTMPWEHAAAILWVISALLDRADGEFARLTRRCSARGHKLDYYGDVAINSAIFLALAMGLDRVSADDSFLWLGAIATVGVAIAAILAEGVELRAGAKIVPSRCGFDFDDTLFLLAPAIWFGWTAPLLIGAAIGGAIAALVLGMRLAQGGGARLAS